MKTKVSQSTVEAYGLQESGEFSFDSSNVKLMLILSDGTYSDKLLAPIRELICNAHDAQVQAGNVDTPMEVHLPNALSPYFGVRDFGPGLCHEHVMKLYTTYGKSTKDESNDFIGGFGIGSKAPFAYCDSFTVISRFKGTKKTYAAIFDKVTPPTISLMNTQATNEPDGLEVTFPVKSTDFSSFCEKTKQIVKRFKVLPVIKGNKEFKINPQRYVYETNSWRIRETSHNTYLSGYGTSTDYDNKPYAIMGNVAYVIDKSIVDNVDASTLLSSPIDINFEIGELEIAASREALSYDKRTIENIIARCRSILTELTKKFEKEFEDCKTYWEACKSFHDKESTFKNTGLQSIFRDCATWKGREVSNQIYINLVTVLNGMLWQDKIYLDFITTDRLQNKTLKPNPNTSGYVIPKSEYIVIHDDLTRGNYSKIYHMYGDYEPERWRRSRGSNKILVIRTDNAYLLNKVIEHLGYPSYERAVDFDEPPKVSRGVSDIAGARLVEYKNSTSEYKSHHWKQFDINRLTKDQGYYIFIKRYEPELENTTLTIKEFNTVYRTISSYLPNGKILIGVPASYKAAFIKDKPANWLPFEQEVIKLCEQTIKNEKALYEKDEIYNVWSNIRYNDIATFAHSLYNSGKLKYTTSIAYVLGNEVHKLEALVTSIKQGKDKRNAILNTYKTIIDNEYHIKLTTKVFDYKAAITKFRQRYPIVNSLYDGYRVSDKLNNLKDDIILYINAKEKGS